MRAKRDARRQAARQLGRRRDLGMREWPTFRMRQPRHRIERTNSAGVGPGFARNKVRVMFRFGTPVSVEVNLKAHFATFEDQQALLPCSASRSIW